MRTIRNLAAAALALACLAGGRAQAGPTFLNEILRDAPGADNGQEFVELLGDPGASLDGVVFLAIDGDGSAAGTIDTVFSLDGLTLGSNGLLLIRDSATVLQPAPAAGTTVVVNDFTPDLENGSITFLLVTGFTGAVGNDLDTNNDGVIDVATPWATVIDAIGLLENDGVNNFAYAAQLGFFDFPQLAFTPDAFVRLADGGGLAAMDVLGTTPGPYAFDPAEYFSTTGLAPTTADAILTPGSFNPRAVPEPASIAAMGLGLGLVGLWAGRRRRAAR